MKYKIINFVVITSGLLLGLWCAIQVHNLVYSDDKPFTVYVNFDNRSVIVDYYTNAVVYPDVNSDMIITGNEICFSTGGFQEEKYHFLELK